MSAHTFFRLFIFLIPSIGLFGQNVSSANDSGPGSLRQAVADASPGATISIATNLAEINLDSEIDIQKNLSIVKAGGSRVKVNIRFQARLFDIANATVSFSNINFANGNTIDGGCIRLDNGVVNIDNCRFENSVASGTMGRGGAIFIRNGGQANISNSIFENNWSNSTGGAIADDSGPGTGLNIDNTQFINNRAGVAPSGAQPGSGGAIFVYGTSTSNISNAVFRDNKASSEGGALWNSAGMMNIACTTIEENTIEGQNSSRGGGGIYNNSGVLNIERSALIDNTANGSVNGGAISIGANGSLNMMTSTLTQNSSNGSGGAVYASSESIQINACTIVGNSAGSTGGGISFQGGGTIKNTILAGNTANSGRDLSGNVTSRGYNLINSDPGSSYNSGTGDKFQDPRLGSLEDNGGVTLTFALLNNSPAYNAGDPGDNFQDQIGQNVFGGRRDIGAYESQDILSSSAELLQHELKLYPNPSSGFIFLDSSVDEPKGNIRIYNSHGQLVKNMDQFSGSRLDCRDLGAGLYILELLGDKKYYRSSFIKL